jgi:hypothetical protein
MGGKNLGAKKIRSRRPYPPWLKTNKMVAKFYNHSGAGEAEAEDCGHL